MFSMIYRVFSNHNVICFSNFGFGHVRSTRSSDMANYISLLFSLLNFRGFPFRNYFFRGLRVSLKYISLWCVFAFNSFAVNVLRFFVSRLHFRRIVLEPLDDVITLTHYHLVLQAVSDI